MKNIPTTIRTSKCFPNKTFKYKYNVMKQKLKGKSEKPKETLDQNKTHNKSK